MYVSFCLLLSSSMTLTGVRPADVPHLHAMKGTRSPKGTYALAFVGKDGVKVDWAKLERDYSYLEKIRSMQDQGNLDTECRLIRTSAGSPVKPLPDIPCWPLGHKLSEPYLFWSPREDAFFISFNSSWYPSDAQVVFVSGTKPGDRIDLLDTLTRSVDRFLKKRGEPVVHGGYHYVWEPKACRFPKNDSLSLNLDLYIPKGASDWEATVRVDVRWRKRSRSYLATVTRVRLLSRQPESQEYKH